MLDHCGTVVYIPYSSASILLIFFYGRFFIGVDRAIFPSQHAGLVYIPSPTKCRVLRVSCTSIDSRLTVAMMDVFVKPACSKCLSLIAIPDRWKRPIRDPEFGGGETPREFSPVYGTLSSPFSCMQQRSDQLEPWQSLDSSLLHG